MTGGAEAVILRVNGGLGSINVERRENGEPRLIGLHRLIPLGIVQKR